MWTLPHTHTLELQFEKPTLNPQWTKMIKNKQTKQVSARSQRFLRGLSSYGVSFTTVHKSLLGCGNDHGMDSR